jgi:large subunit ribosomal protein L4e
MAKIISLAGVHKGEMKLPTVFSASYRPDLIQRAVLSSQAARRQPYGTDFLAGKRTAAHDHGVKDSRGSMKNREITRGPRSHGGNPGQELRARFEPQSRGGRRAFPPRVEKVFDLKINKKEMRLALASAIAATADANLVKAHGHRISEQALPIIAESGIETVTKARDIESFLRALKLEAEIKRANISKVRAGKGKMRGRRHRTKKSVIFIVAEDKGLLKAAKNLAGVDAITVGRLTTEMLAPGGTGGRLAVWSEDAIKKLSEIYG